MALYGALAKENHLSEFTEPLILGDTGTITPAERIALVLANLGMGALSVEAGVGITEGTGTVYASSVQKIGGIYHTKILVDITGLTSSATNNDIIGVDATALRTSARSLPLSMAPF